MDYESVIYWLGESYRQYNDFGNAEKYYEQAVNFNNNTLFPQPRFWYGVCLRANGKYPEALEQLKQFKQQYTHTDYNRLRWRFPAVNLPLQKQTVFRDLQLSNWRRSEWWWDKRCTGNG